MTPGAIVIGNLTPGRTLSIIRIIACAAIGLISSCSSPPPIQEQPSVTEVAPIEPRRKARLVPLPEFPATTAPPSALVEAAAPSLLSKLARLDRDSAGFSAIFGFMLWLILSLVSVFYRYQLKSAGFIARSLIAGLLSAAFTVYWVTASGIALMILGATALTLLTATISGWRRGRRNHREAALARSGHGSPHDTDGPPPAGPGLVRENPISDSADKRVKPVSFLAKR